MSIGFGIVIMLNKMDISFLRKLIKNEVENIQINQK